MVLEHGWSSLAISRTDTTAFSSQEATLTVNLNYLIERPKLGLLERKRSQVTNNRWSVKVIPTGFLGMKL